MITPLDSRLLQGGRSFQLKTHLYLAASLIALHLTVTSAAFAQHGHQHGKVEFPNSCSPTVQAKLLDGIAMLHSFFYSGAQQAFEEVAAEDNSCTIATWGYASILMLNPLQGIGPSPQNARLAQAAIDKARKIGAKTQREHDYLEAVAAYYEDFASHPERARQLARAKAYEALSAKYPDDDEAQIFYALYLAGTQSPSDQTYSAYLKAAEILETQFVKHPNHPGVAHYLIHCYDAPPIAAKGLPAARRYAGIAPDVPHALHMPSHIFTRVGAWAESIATNRRSANVARSIEPDEALHAMDYMTYAYLQLARDRDARNAFEEARALVAFNPGRATAPYALAAMPARYVVERGAWSEASKLEPTPTTYPFTEAMTHFARALGAARNGDGAAAQKDVDRIVVLRDELKAASQTGNNEYWAKEVEVMRLASAAWIALAQRQSNDAVALMRQAADIEDKSEKNIVTPGRLLPARELLGDMLLELHRPAEALKEYEASQQREPNRYRGWYGAGQAAAQSGNRQKARYYFSKLIDLAGAGDPRPETEKARRYLLDNQDPRDPPK
jgi:tetratricopeptide (TPR) repeat protein